jgi:MFS family permease
MTADISGPRPAAEAAAPHVVRLGLRANWPQFTLLVVVNVFVGGMVGLERATTTLVGTRVFHLSGYLAVFSFIIAFGVTKAVTNLAAGPLIARHNRKNLLVAGWAAGLPVPFLLAWAPAWGWIVAANVCLGVNQGLTSSMVVNMKMDLTGPRGRGLAMGLNEAAGYVAVGATALATGYLAAAYGLRPVPELIGAIYAAVGLILSAVLVRDTAAHVAAETAETAQAAPATQTGAAEHPFLTVFKDTTWRSRPLRGASQAGLANNLNDGLTWAVFPLLFASHGLGLAAIGLIKGLYPMVWGGGQLLTGRLADTIGRRPMIVAGMMVQAAAFPAALVLLARPLVAGLTSAILLGVGTAMAQPALSAAVADHTHPSWRARGLGVYRFWRDLGYAIGAVIAGLVAQAFGLSAAVIAGGVLTFASGLLAARWLTAGSPQPVGATTTNSVLTPCSAMTRQNAPASGGDWAVVDQRARLAPAVAHVPVQRVEAGVQHPSGNQR